MDGHNNQQPPFPLYYGYQYAQPQPNNFPHAMQYSFPPPPFHEMNFPPPIPYGIYPPPPPQPFAIGPHAQQTSYPPAISHSYVPNYSPLNQYPQAAPYLSAQQRPSACSSMPTSNTHPQTNKVSGSYSSHKSTSKRPLPIKSSQKPHSSSSSSTRTEYKKSHQHSAHEDEPITPLDEYSSLTPEEIIENEKKTWTRCAPADLYYARDLDNPKLMRGTDKLKATFDQFRIKLLERGDKARTMQPKFDYPPRKTRRHSTQCGGSCKDKSKKTCESDSSTSDSSSEEEDEVDLVLQELERKKQHPSRLHPELWFNDPGEMNDGPLCRCSFKARRTGIRHGIYAGEKSSMICDRNSNNGDILHHYRVTISPPTNFLLKRPTVIHHDGHEFIFEGFSLLSHYPLDKVPTCKVIRFNIEYTIVYIEEKVPDNFTIQELELFSHYLFHDLLELVDFNLHAAGDTNGCPQFHILPRFVRDLPDHGKEMLSMNQVLQYLIQQNVPVIDETELGYQLKLPQHNWQNMADFTKGMIVMKPGSKPCSLRVDQLDRDQLRMDVISYPEIVHFGIRPPQLSYAGNPEYQKAWRDYVKFRHLLANMPKPSFEDKRKLEAKENRLQEMRLQNNMKRDVTVAVSSEGFYRTGIMCDVVQHGMLLPVLITHLRFHKSLDVLEDRIKYRFKNRYLLQLALTHPSYRENFGTNPDHARNSLTNCGIRQPEYGDRRIHYMNTRKRGINTLINIMSRLGKKQETESSITHNERLEFLGDAVVEFLASIHLYHMFPDLEEGGLATYRAAIVQNQHLAQLAKNLQLDQFMLYAHGSDLCHDLELRHAMANCFEALMGALFLDGGINVADRVFSNTLFMNEKDLLDVWVNYPSHPLQEQELGGDRKWIASFPLLQKMVEFEESIGIKFTHIRLLARAFTDRSIGFNNLTLGSNQRLEFLGDTVLQLIASEYLYKFFPEHHEGHLSLLRSSLVNNRTQAVVCDDLGMTNYALYSSPKAELKTKDRADLLEAFLGALYVDKGLEDCQTFCQVCFFPRLQDFILHQDWNDPKSKLQQCCLTLRTMDGGEPDIPVYKVIECKGPTNTRVYSVAVYFRGIRLASASGHSIQQAEMNAAKEALEKSKDLFPQLNHQKKVIANTSVTMPNRKTGSGYPHVEGNGASKFEEKEVGASTSSDTYHPDWYLRRSSSSKRDTMHSKDSRSRSNRRSRSSSSRSRSRSSRRTRSRSPRRTRSRSPVRSRSHSSRRNGNYSPRRNGNYSPRRNGNYSPRRNGNYSPRRSYSPSRSRSNSTSSSASNTSNRSGSFVAAVPENTVTNICSSIQTGGRSNDLEIVRKIRARKSSGELSSSGQSDIEDKTL